MSHPAISRPKQSDFLALPDSPIPYWLNPNFLELLGKSELLSSYVKTIEGLNTTCNDRFLRFQWEADKSSQWRPYSKGGGYRRWYGNIQLVVKWGNKGNKIKFFIEDKYKCHWSKRVSGINFYDLEGWNWSLLSRGSLGLRRKEQITIFDVRSGGLFIQKSLGDGIVAILNARITSYILRVLVPVLDFHAGYVSNVALPIQWDEKLLASLVNFCISLRYVTTSLDLLEFSFDVNGFQKISKEGISFKFLEYLDICESIELRVLIAEAQCEEAAIDSYGLDAQQKSSVIIETGTPAGWFSLISGYDRVPELSSDFPEIPAELIDFLANHPRRTLATTQLIDLKRRLRSLYEAGVGAKVAEETEIDLTDEEEAEEESEGTVGAHIPIPTETFVEELSVRLEVHPISVYWLLQEGRQEGWRCIPEEKRFTEDQFTVRVLRLLGHRWHKQIEAGEAVPDWADQDGVIPISKGTHEQALGDRVRERIGAEFPHSTIASISAEFEEIVGISLEKWLSGAFFKRHISQFKKRPIAWQIESSPIISSRNNRANPAFSCLIYYHKLDGDLLPKLRSQYVGILRQGYETELRNLEAMFKEQRSAKQVACMLQLPDWIEALKTLEAILYEVSTTGFGPDFLKPRLRQLAIDDATLCLKARWLRKLMQVIQTDSLARWMDAAIATKLHPDFAQWIETAFSHIAHHCSQVGSQPPDAEDLEQDPTVSDLAKHICQNAGLMLNQTLTLACMEWRAKFDEVLIAPLKQQIKEADAELKALKEQIIQLGNEIEALRRNELETRVSTLKADIKGWKATSKALTAKGDMIRKQIEAWECSDSKTWEPWLATQPVYDQISSLSDRRTPPQTIAEFIAQESTYTPDLNDGVRVNIAPLQRAGLLANDVLAAKDIDKAMGDRAEWRADERRWCREGKLPQPGWWKIDIL